MDFESMSQSLLTQLSLPPSITLRNAHHPDNTSQSSTPRPGPHQLDSESVYYSNLDDRHASSSRASDHSLSSTTTGTSSNVPPLKRKSGNKHMRDQLHSARTNAQVSAPRTSTNTVFPPVTNDQTNVRYPSPTRLNQVQLARSNTAPSPKRPPASHSSYGVETVAGPPPSFDTRRTWSQEKVWRVDRSKSLRMTLGSERAESLSQPQQDIHPQDQKEFAEPKQQSPATPLLTQSSPDTNDTSSVPTPTDAEQVPVMEMRSEHGLGVSHSEIESKTSSESHKSEDLFLNIARSDAGRPSSSKGERRRSRVSLPYFSAARPATSYNPDGFSLSSDTSGTTPRAEVPPHHSKQASLHLGQLRSLDQTSDHGSTDVSNSGHQSRRTTTTYTDSGRTYQRSVGAMRSNRLVSEGGYLDRSKYGEQNATESTVSTAAPSTVWDELDDLKSRIRKLELTGKLPPSSAAAMSSAERPRTATTAATTMSSSPKHNNVPPSLQSTVEVGSSGTHSLLHEALSNAQAAVGQDIYQKLQSTAQDAMQLAALTNYDAQSTRSGTPLATDRQLRRRTESICRSLTELAIALAVEAKPAQQAYRPASREVHASPAMGLRSRRYSQSNEPTDRPPVSGRIQSRLETRRASTQVGYSPANRLSPDVESPTTALPPYSGSTTRGSRITTVHRARRPGGLLDGADGEQESIAGIRPLSRAVTDVAARRISRDYMERSREYTSQHPMPSKTDLPSSTRTPLPPNLSTNFISRRKFTSPAGQPAPDSSPLASRQTFGRISVVHQDTPPPSDIASEAPGTGRSLTTRRSFGLASRIGSSVGNRLRSSKAERGESKSYKDSPAARGEGGFSGQDVSYDQQQPHVRN